MTEALPDRVTIYEVGPRDGLQNEQGIVPVEAKAEFIRRLLGGRPARRRGHQLRAPEVGAPAGRRRRADEPADRGRAGRGRQGAAGAGAERTRAGPCAGARLSPHRDLRQRHRDLRATQPQPQSRRAVRDVRAHRGAGPGSRAGRAGVRQHVSRRPVGGGRADRPGGRCGQAPLRPRCQPALARRHDRRRDGGSRARAADRTQRRRDCPTTHSRCTSTTPTGRLSPTPSPRCSTASPRSTPVPAASAAARTPRAPRATSPPRTSSGCCTASGIETGVDLAALVETSTWMAGVLGRPSPSRVVAALSPAQ